MTPVCQLQDLSSWSSFHSLLCPQPEVFHECTNLYIILPKHHHFFNPFKNSLLRPHILRYNLYIVIFTVLDIQFYKFWHMHVSPTPPSRSRILTSPPKLPSCPLCSLSPSPPLVPGTWWSDFHHYSFGFSRTSLKWHHTVCSFLCLASFTRCNALRSICVVVCIRNELFFITK